VNNKRPALILVADDEEAVRIIVRDSLVYAGFRVLEAKDGAEAVHLARTKSPDLVLLDLAMPVMDGMTALRYIRESGVKTHVIVISQDETAKSAVGIMKLGGVDYLSKPFDMEYLVQAIKRVLLTETPLNANRTATHGNVIQIKNYGQMHNTQIQQSSHRASQALELRNFLKENVSPLVARLQKSTKALKVRREEKRQLASDVRILKTQLSVTKPNPKILYEVLKSVRDILEGAAGGALGAAFISHMDKIIATVRDFLR
jgi:DNA-binding response OmpR family regulator